MAADPEAVSPVVELGVSAAAQLEAVSVVAAPEVVSASVESQVSAADPKVVSVVAQPEAFAAVAPEAVSVDIAVAFVVLVLASAVVAEADSSEHPRFLAFPNADHFASSSSSVEVAG